MRNCARRLFGWGIQNRSERKLLRQELLQRLPVMLVPSRTEVVVVALGESGVVENDPRSAALRAVGEPDHGIDARVPVGGTPCLDDALTGNQLNVAADDHPAKHGERAALMRIDGRRHAAERGELFCIEESLFEARGGSGQIDLLVKRGAHVVGFGRRHLRHRRGLLVDRTSQNGCRGKSAEGHGDSAEDGAPRGRQNRTNEAVACPHEFSFAVNAWEHAPAICSRTYFGRRRPARAAYWRSFESGGRRALSQRSPRPCEIEDRRERPPPLQSPGIRQCVAGRHHARRWADARGLLQLFPDQERTLCRSAGVFFYRSGVEELLGWHRGRSGLAKCRLTSGERVSLGSTL